MTFVLYCNESHSLFPELSNGIQHAYAPPLPLPLTPEQAHQSNWVLVEEGPCSVFGGKTKEPGEPGSSKGGIPCDVGDAHITKRTRTSVLNNRQTPSDVVIISTPVIIVIQAFLLFLTGQVYIMQFI